MGALQGPNRVSMLRSFCCRRVSRPQPHPHLCSRAQARTSVRAMSTAIEHSGSTDGTHGVQDGKSNAWIGAKGRGAFDLRSDVMTTPTPSMLAAIASCSLYDDVFQEDTTTAALEAHCAQLVGKEAGLFVLSGTMGNQLALRALLRQPPHGVLCDHRAHIVRYEAGGVSSLTGAMVTAVVPAAKGGAHLTLEDVVAHAQVGEEREAGEAEEEDVDVDIDMDVHSCPTRVVSLENTLNGTVLPLSEARRIAGWARAHGVKMHCDGARLWEAAASGAGSLRDYGACFDTLTLCFSKGLGAPVGSVLVGSRALVRRARWVRKSIGGGLRQAGVVTAAARVAVDETFGSGPSGEGGLLRHTHGLAREVERLWVERGGRVLFPVQTNMCWLDLAASGLGPARFEELGREEGLRLMGGRMVVHYQIWQNRDEVLPRLARVFTRALGQAKQHDNGEQATAHAHVHVHGQSESKSMYRLDQQD